MVHTAAWARLHVGFVAPASTKLPRAHSLDYAPKAKTKVNCVGLT